MADFDPAYEFSILGNEGGYANNPADPGGETYRGISRHYSPDWPGWVMVDEKKAGSDSSTFFPKMLDSDEPLQALVKSFYLSKFWKFDGLNSQPVANKVFDMGVQDGVESSIKMLQTGLCAIKGHFSVAVDGRYGPATEAATNAVTATHEARLLRELRAQMALYYCKHANPMFMDNWIRRAVK